MDEKLAQMKFSIEQKSHSKTLNPTKEDGTPKSGPRPVVKEVTKSKGVLTSGQQQLFEAQSILW
jgi:hypothetical protein